MINELHYFDVFPKVIPAESEAVITIKPLGAHVEFTADVEVHFRIQGLDDGNIHHYPERNNQFDYYQKPDADGCVRITHLFGHEQEYYISIFEGTQRKYKFSVYAVNKDLIGRYPLRGDLHMHTFRSDGKQSPEVVCANYRKYGYDFSVISDHRRYYPSLDAMAAYKDVPTEFTIVPGEEIHLHNDFEKGYINDVHIVNFGSEYSVNALIDGGEQSSEVGNGKEFRAMEGCECPDVISAKQYQDEVLALAETLDIPEGIEKFAYASCVWIFNHIKRGGGLGIFAHPYWISNVYQVPPEFCDYMLSQKPFDAFEVLGGERYFEQNGFQTISYYEQLAKGNKFPIVGSSDSHGSVNNEKARIAATIVFSPANERTEIIKSVKDYYSVAVDNISTEWRIIGDLRLVKYATFLMNNYFPLHDDLCYEEGRLMKDYVCGEKDAKKTLEFINGRVQRQREKYFKF